MSAAAFATLTLNCEQLKRASMYDSVPPINVGVGPHTVAVQFDNYPVDQKEAIERLNNSVKEWRENYNVASKANREYESQIYNLNDRVATMQRELREAQQQAQTASSDIEDRPRPPLPNETLQALIALMANPTREWTTELVQVQTIRLLTGWSLTQAQAFVRGNQPAVAVAE